MKIARKKRYVELNKFSYVELNKFGVVVVFVAFKWTTVQLYIISRNSECISHVNL